MLSFLSIYIYIYILRQDHIALVRNNNDILVFWLMTKGYLNVNFECYKETKWLYSVDKIQIRNFRHNGKLHGRKNGAVIDMNCQFYLYFR